MRLSASCASRTGAVTRRIGSSSKNGEVPERVEGTLQFTGPSATSGYYHNPDATAHLLSGEWRDTGDRAYLAAGELFITGRVKDIIIRRGQHLYPDEIESAVGELVGVRKGCVVALGTRDPRTATERLVIVAETRIADATMRSNLKRHINERVVECVGEPPEVIVLAPPHAVAKTSSGKLRRAATRAAFEDGSLGRAHAGPALQMLRLRIEGAWHGSATHGQPDCVSHTVSMPGACSA
jgi:acyl-CoA synthetase (AMP-forming)/AMP-acid ligase II